MRLQLLREKIGVAHAVIYTHEHADHLMAWMICDCFRFISDIPYRFTVRRWLNKGFVNRLIMLFAMKHPRTMVRYRDLPSKRIHPFEKFSVLGTEILPLRLQHGPRFEVLGFRIGNVAYCTDTNQIPAESLSLLENLDVLVLDALRVRPT